MLHRAQLSLKCMGVSHGLQTLALFFRSQGEKLGSKSIPSLRKPEISVSLLELAGLSFRPPVRLLGTSDSSSWRVETNLASWFAMPALGMPEPSL